MEKIDRKMSLLMGATFSVFLSFVGLMNSGRFTMAAYLRSLLISFPASLILGYFIPVGKINRWIAAKLHLERGSLIARIVEALVSSLLFSPLMTFIMVYIAWRQAVAHGAPIPLGRMLIKPEIISFITSFILSLIVSPLYLKLLTKDNQKPVQ